MAEKQKKHSEEAVLTEVSARVEEDARRVEKATIRLLRSQPKVRIQIPSGRTPHERAPVPVCVNGREFLIVRDREVDVPEGVVNVLRLAREQVAVTSERDGQLAVRWEEAPRIPFQVLGRVDVLDGQAGA